jgi:catechol 2,3-dioxygenase-like lactoylglutathione lyase family enzyme
MTILRGLIAALLVVFGAAAALAQPAEPTPLISRIKMATIGAPDVAKVEDWYTRHLDFKVREKGKVSAAMAASWGAPKSAGRPFVLLSSDGSPDVFIRAVGIDAVPGFKPQTTLGWNAFEIIIDDIDKVNAKMKGSPFTIIGEPHSLGGPFASIVAMQVVGPAGEVLYLTTETGDRAKSTLPEPKALVDRPFIFILAGHDVDALSAFYGGNFAMKVRARFDGPVALAAKAQGLPEDHVFGLGLVRAAERGNNIELDGYPPSAGPRPRADGQLPPGNAMASFNVNSLDGLKVKFVAAPAKLYGPKRAATFVGPAGEITELIEEPRP